MKAMKLSSLKSSFSLIRVNPFKFSAAKFSDKIRDKEVAEEKFYFDKEESKLFQINI
jgi:hypothetical protein